MQPIEVYRKIADEISVSDEAMKQLSALTAAEDDVSGVRIFVSGGGCGGMTYGLTFVEKPSEYDCVLEGENVDIYIDAVALSFLGGLEVDYKVDGVSSSFVFKNGFANTGGSGTCGTCGAAGGGCA